MFLKKKGIAKCKRKTTNLSLNVGLNSIRVKA